MKLNKILFGTFMIATVGLMLSCSSKDDDNGNEINNGEREKEIKGEMKKAELLGFVKDTDGNPLADVKVGSGTAVTTTDATGAFALANIEVVEGRTVVDFTKDGYFDVVRSVTKADKDKWEVVMVSKTKSDITDAKTYPSASAQTLSTDDGMQVKMPSDGYKNAKTGKDYTGTVNTEMLYLNPDDENFATMMPGGDLAAVDANNKTVQLVSYGMTKVEMTDNAGNALQLKDGKEAQLTFPIPESLKDNTPAQIPLWSFNENTGLWEEEGLATLQNGVYVGTVKHFSWVNLDWPESRVTVIIKVKTKKGTLVPWIRVHVGQTTCTTNSQGEAQCFIPENTDVKIWVESEDYGDYSPVVSINVQGQAGATTVQKELILPDLPYIKGKVVNKEGSALSTVWIEYGNNKTKFYHTDLDGSFSIMSPKGYTGPATLKIRAANGETFSKTFTITGQDVNLGDVDINAKIDPTKTQGGIVYVNTDAGKTYELPITITNENVESGATIIDNMFYVTNANAMDQEGNWNDPNFQMTRWMFTSENYDRAKGTATGNFVYMIEGSKGHTIAEVPNANYEVKITGKQIVLNMNGRGLFQQIGPNGEGYDPDINEDTGNAAFTGAGLTFDIMMSAETRKPFTKSFAPSFMPFIGSSYPIGLAITGFTYFSKGAQAYCGGDRSTFNQLVSICDANLKGWTKTLDDDEEDAEVTYYSASEGKLVIIEYDSWENWSDDEVEEIESAYDIDAPITVYALEGLTVDPATILNDNEEYYKAPRRAVAKVKTMRNKLLKYFKK